MRSSRRQLLLAAAILIFLVVSWDFLGCLVSVGYTYAYWTFFPKTQLSFPPPQGSKPVVPNIIHQTWKSNDIPEKWQAAQKSCQEAHPGFEYRLWTDQDSTEFIKEHYPWFLETFLSYPFPIQRADVIRYFVLYHYGGIYIDLDIECKTSLEPSLQHFDFTAPLTYPVGISNDIFASAPGSKFLERAIRQLPRWNRWLGPPYVQIMFSTGPMFLTVQYALSGRKIVDTMALLPADVYGKYETSERVALGHLHGSSWHEDDAAFIMWLDKYKLPLLILGVAAVVGLIVGVVYYRRTKKSSPIALYHRVDVESGGRKLLD